MRKPYCLCTKKNQTKLKRYANMRVLFLFILFIQYLKRNTQLATIASLLVVLYKILHTYIIHYYIIYIKRKLPLYEKTNNTL